DPHRADLDGFQAGHGRGEIGAMALAGKPGPRPAPASPQAPARKGTRHGALARRRSPPLPVMGAGPRAPAMTEGRTVALVVAAGSGSRAGGGIPKQFRPLAGRPLLAHALDHLAHSAIDAVQVVIGEGQEAAYAAAVGDRPRPAPVIGGTTRQQSVRRGLEALAGQGIARVLIHDAARPFLPAEVIDRLLGALDAHDGAAPALGVVDTLAHVED